MDDNERAHIAEVMRLEAEKFERTNARMRWWERVIDARDYHWRRGRAHQARCFAEWIEQDRFKDIMIWREEDFRRAMMEGLYG